MSYLVQTHYHGLSSNGLKARDRRDRGRRGGISWRFVWVDVRHAVAKKEQSKG